MASLGSLPWDERLLHFLGTIFSVWHTIGQVNTFGLSTLSLISLALGAVSIVAAYLTLHKAGFALLLAHMNVGLLAGFGNFSWAGQVVHVSCQHQALLNAAITVDHLTPAAELLPSSPKDSITVDEFFGGYDGAVLIGLACWSLESLGSLASSRRLAKSLEPT